MNYSTSQEWHRLFSAALNDSITSEEKAQLAALLKANAEARQLWFIYHDNECGFAELKKTSRKAEAAVQEPPAKSARGGRFTWSPLTAAAAGLVFGLFSASMVWGYVGTFANRTLTLLTDSFEMGTPPLVTGMPVTPGRWSGDFSEVVGSFGGVAPAQGKKMLRFRRADYEGKPVHDGYVADLFRIVDLREAGREVSTGEAMFAIEAHFAAQPQGALQQGISCGVTIYALDSLPPAGMRDDAFLRWAHAGLSETAEADGEPRILASATRSAAAPADGATWCAVRSELRLPEEARYALLHLRAHLRGSDRAETPKPVEFSGLFLDDIHLSLTLRAARP